MTLMNFVAKIEETCMETGTFDAWAIVEVMGQGGEPPYRVRYDDGHECILSPGPDSTVEHGRGATPTR